jgi:regulator of protease activity HflC (stomatin/prohibitin superfamily)
MESGSSILVGGIFLAVVLLLLVAASGVGLLLALLIAVLVLVVFLVLSGLFLISENQVGILTRKMLGTPMPQGQVIARHGQVGVQAATLVPGLYWRMPIIWAYQKAPVVQIDQDKVGMVESIDGLPLPKGRLLGDEIESNQFQDAERFLDGGGFKGPQIAILRPGKYRINTRAFLVRVGGVTAIAPEQMGIVTALDGIPLPPRFIVAPEPTGIDVRTGKPRNHNFYQDGQAFIDVAGYRGTQLSTLQAGEYYINPMLFSVQITHTFEVPPGFVSVLRSNVGEELERSETRPTPVQVDPNFDQTITAEVESLLILDRTRRGIWRSPLAPGKYNLNTVAFTAYAVPTSAIMVDWASEDSATAASMSRPPAVPLSDTSNIPYKGPRDTLKGAEFFRFGQLQVTSKDGFQLEVDVRVVIRVLPENAAFVIARFGSVFNLIQQIVHPLVDAEFRNSAGEKKALEFVQARSQLQQEALTKARESFSKYLVEAQNLLISYIKVDQALLATQTQKEIALQQQEQYRRQAEAEQERIAVQEKTAIANKQPEVVQARLDVDINANQAVALVKQAEGIRDSTKIRADGDAAAIIRVGTAQADAYHAQADVLGAERVALVKIFEQIQEGKIVITPETLVVAGPDGTAGSGALFSAFLATLLSGKATIPKDSFRPSEGADYVSGLMAPPAPTLNLSVPPATPPPPPPPPAPAKAAKPARVDDDR